MKLGKRDLGMINSELIVIPRGSSEDIVLKMEAVQNFDEFDKILTEPEPPYVTLSDGTQTRDIVDKDYLENLGQFNARRLNYMVIKGLQNNEDLTWDRVKIEEPETWKEWTEEFREAKFSEVEIRIVLNAMHKANCLDEDYVEEARMRFLQKQATQKASS